MLLTAPRIAGQADIMLLLMVELSAWIMGEEQEAKCSDSGLMAGASATKCFANNECFAVKAPSAPYPENLCLLVHLELQ